MFWSEVAGACALSAGTDATANTMSMTPQAITLVTMVKPPG